MLLANTSKYTFFRLTIALEMIWNAEKHYHLRIKGGLCGLGLVSGSAGRIMISDLARDEFHII
ncbi:MAG: hypothetical protein EOP04_05590 [Proteobacteria bacterium]|nr:MAG: hypothetical protein EOP04_05590 [Pseudomonadota bacterium]